MFKSGVKMCIYRRYRQVQTEAVSTVLKVIYEWVDVHLPLAVRASKGLSVVPFHPLTACFRSHFRCVCSASVDYS